MRPHGLVNLSSHHPPQSVTARTHVNSWLYTQTSKDILRRHLRCSYFDLIPFCVEILGVIMSANTEQIRQTLICIINSFRLKVAKDHVRNLSSPQKSILFLSSLLFNTNSFSERGTGNDLSQRRRNPRIKHRTIRKGLSFN